MSDRPSFDLVVRNARVATASDSFVSDIGIRDGVIQQLGHGLAAGARDGDDDGGALAPVFHGVVEEVLEHLNELIALAGDAFAAINRTFV